MNTREEIELFLENAESHLEKTSLLELRNLDKLNRKARDKDLNAERRDFYHIELPEAVEKEIKGLENRIAELKDKYRAKTQKEHDKRWREAMNAYDAFGVRIETAIVRKQQLRRAETAIVEKKGVKSSIGA